MAELRRALPRDIGQLKTRVNAFAEYLDYADVEKNVRNIRDCERACITKTESELGWRCMEGFIKCPNLIMRNIYLHLNKSIVLRVWRSIKKRHFNRKTVYID